MKEVFKYTFITISDIKKFLIVVMLVSILTILEAYPVLNTVAFLFEKLIFLSIGVFLIYLVKKSISIESYFENLKQNSISTFLFHFIPSASGILLGILLIMTFWIMFFIMILEFTSSMFIFADPHQLISSIEKTTFITKILIGFYLVYFMFFSYIFLGKFGEALNQENFKNAFLSTISSLIDFQFWIKTFNLRYFIIYLVWSSIIGIIYSITSFTYLFVLLPQIILNPNISLIVIPIFVAITTILSYFTFFSAHFSYKSTMEKSIVS